jgi:hypothetical protein
LRGDRGSRGCDGAQSAVVELHGVLADLQDDRTAGPFCTCDDRLGVLEGDDVEGHHSRPRAVCGGNEIGGSGKRHLFPSRC